jgi:tetratricopeptide (TPR) repeat protein
VIRTTTDARTYAFAVGSVFAVTSLAIHALCDFPLYIPAILVAAAAWCGSVSAVAARLPRVKGAVSRCFTRWTVFAAPTVAASLLAAACWGSDELFRYAPIETALKTTNRHAEASQEIAPADYRADLERMAAAQRAYPDDAEAHYCMARLWLSLYRTQTLEQLRAKKVPGEPAALWNLTSPLMLHRRAWEYIRAGQIDALRRLPTVRDDLRPALAEAVLAGQCCPAWARPPQVIAELGILVAAPTADPALIERARRLAPGSPEVLLLLGTLEFQGGRVEAGCADWHKALELDFQFSAEVLPLALRFLGSDRMIEKVLPNSPQQLVDLVRRSYAAPEQAEIRRKIARRAEALLGGAVLPEAEGYYLRGSIAAMAEDYPRAIENYRRAVALRAGTITWRYELAMLLVQQGMVDAAHEQAQLCARLDPDNGDYRNLLERIDHARLMERVDWK